MVWPISDESKRIMITALAPIAVAFAAVLLWPPHVRRGLYEKRPLPLWVVRVAEVDPPKGVKPLEWILLTNRPVATLEDAWERVAWYACRWVIEEYHKAQKTGCAIEELQFTSSAALMPMIALLSVVAVTLLNCASSDFKSHSTTWALATLA